MMRRLLLAAVLGLGVGGCGGVTPDTFAEPVDVTGKVTAPGGKPVKDLVLNFQPLGDGLPVPVKLGADGAFTAKVIPGKYTYYVTAKSGRTTDEVLRNEDAWMKTVPEKFRSGDKDRVIKVEPGQSLDLKLE